MFTLAKNIKIFTIKYGLLLGAILLFLSIFSFYFITEFSNSPVLFVVVPLLCSVIFPIFLALLFCFYARKKNDGFWSFKEATRGIFFIFFIAYIILTIGKDLIFAKIIEPDMVAKTEAAFVRSSSFILEKTNIDKKQMAQQIENKKKDFESQKNITIAEVIQSIAISIIFIFVLALIFGALFKRDMQFMPASIEE